MDSLGKYPCLGRNEYVATPEVARKSPSRECRRPWVPIDRVLGMDPTPTTDDQGLIRATRLALFTERVASERFQTTTQDAPTSADEQSVRFRAETRARQRSFEWTAALILVTAPVDIHPANHHLWAGWLVRLGMAAVAFASARRLTRVSPIASSRLSVFAGLVASLGYCVLVALSGGRWGPNYNWTLVVPIAGVVVAGESLWYAVPFSLLNTAVAVFLVHDAGEGRGAMLNSACEHLSAGGIAVIAAVYWRRLKTAQAQMWSQLREARERFSRAERLALVGQLAAGVAHEINNPLGFVKSNLAFVQQGIETTDEEVRNALDESRAGVLRIQQIVTDLKSFAQEDDGASESCSVDQVVEEALRVAAHRIQGIRIQKTVPKDLPAVRVRRHRLIQVVLNLLLNAADALEGPGQSGAILVVARRDGQGVELVIEDNGPGFCAEHLPRMFTPFFTTKPPGKGTGLGLALSRTYLQRDGASIQGENVTTGGARFRIRLAAESECVPEPPLEVAGVKADSSASFRRPSPE
jgi:signal transduction histidine kinase